MNSRCDGSDYSLPRLIPEIFPLAQVFYSLGCAERPMVKSCILHNLGGYTVENPPTRQTHSNTALVLRNLAVIPAAEPTIDLVLGLLILSLSPASRTDASLPRTPDPYEASARGLRVALRLGLNKAAARLARRGMGGASSDQMNQLILVGNNSATELNSVVRDQSPIRMASKLRKILLRPGSTSSLPTALRLVHLLHPYFARSYL